MFKEVLAASWPLGFSLGGLFLSYAYTLFPNYYESAAVTAFGSILFLFGIIATAILFIVKLRV